MIINNQNQENKVKNITLVYCWGNENVGDKAITLGTLKLLGKTFPQSQIRIISVFSEKQTEFHKSALYLKEKYPDIIFLPNFLKYPNKGLKLLFLFFSLLLPKITLRIFPNNQAIKALAEADLVISNAGHLFFWNKPMGEKLGNLLRAYPLIIARRLKISYGFCGQSFGPFEFGPFDGLAKLFYKWLFSGSRFIYTRENKSQSEIADLIDKSKCNLKTILDSAFFIETDEDETAKAVLKKYNLETDSFIIITLRFTKRGSAKNLEEEKYIKYSKKIISFIRQWIERKKIPIVILCQASGDIKNSKFIYEHLSGADKDYCQLIVDRLSPEELKSLYQNVRILVGMRFHSLIFALSANRPVLGLYYYDLGPKTPGLMNDLGLGNYVFDIDDVSEEELFQRANELDEARNKISKEIEEKLTLKKKETFDTMKKIRRSLS